MGETLFSLQVVHDGEGSIRCVYLNNFRIVGEKPYVSEGLAHWHRPFALNELRHAFPSLQIEEAPDALYEALRDLYAATPDNEGGALGAACAKARAALAKVSPQEASGLGSTQEKT